MLKTILYAVVSLLVLFQPVHGKYVRELTDNDFESVVSKEKMVLVNFYAHWCPHCQRLKPIYEKAAEALHRKYPSIPIVQIDCAGRGKKTCSNHPIRGYPTVRLFKDGRGIEKFRGRRTVARFVEFIKKRAPTPTPPPTLAPTVAPASWSSWSDWSGCSVTCGVGARTRNRVCEGSSKPGSGRCSGDDVETESCTLKPCVAVVTEWSKWSDWGSCSVTCGLGRRTRLRVCGGPNTPGVKSCVGDSVETESCSREPSDNACRICQCQGNKMDCRMLRLVSVPQNIPTNIERLDLSRNQIVNLPPDVFNRNTNIKILNLGKNRIRALPVNVFKSLVKLERLYLFNNQLSRILPGTFDGLLNLASLQLSNNQLKALPANVFAQLVNLKYLSLQGNSLSFLPNNLFDRLYLLRRIQLYNNKLLDIPNGIFKDSNSVNYLALHRNKLSQLKRGAFEGLTSLERMTLHQNNIVDVENGLLNEMTKLNHLDLSRNKISSLPSGFLSSFKVGVVRRIKVSHNPLACSCELYQNIDPFKSKIWGNCDGNVKISSMTAMQYCRPPPVKI